MGRRAGGIVGRPSLNRTCKDHRHTPEGPRGEPRGSEGALVSISKGPVRGELYRAARSVHRQLWKLWIESTATCFSWENRGRPVEGCRVSDAGSAQRGQD